jgi:uncharacterized alkaline shock family protein YloU
MDGKMSSIPRQALFGKSLINPPKSCIIYRVFFRILQPGYFLGMCKEAYSMECKVKNDYGTIYIAEDVMLKVVGYAALECYGIVAMSGKRATDGISEWLGRENLSKGVQIRNVGDMLDVDLFIIVEYGISISEVCKTIVETVRYKLESMTGVKVRKISISVEGIRI